MSYSTIARCANDQAFFQRLAAACAQEDFGDDPQGSAQTIRWDVSAKSDIEAAYAPALAADNPNPGDDPTVITDGMILAAVQSMTP